MPNNGAKTKNFFMEFVGGTSSNDIWYDLGEEGIISFSCQFAELESKMMFSRLAGACTTKDLEKVARGPASC